MYTWRVHLLEHSEGTALGPIGVRAKEGLYPKERLLVVVFELDYMAGGEWK